MTRNRRRLLLTGSAAAEPPPAKAGLVAKAKAGVGKAPSIARAASPAIRGSVAEELQPQPKARAGQGAPRRRNSQQTRGEHFTALFKYLWRAVPKLTMAGAFIIVGVVHSGKEGPVAQVSRALSAAAEVAETTAAVTNKGLNLTSQISSDVIVWTKDLVSTGSNFVADLHLT